MTDKLRRALTELVGTFVFLVVGAGVVITDNYTRGALGLPGIALAHGLILSIIMTAFGPISGGHFNPAITVGLRFANKIDNSTLGFYIAAQLMGGVLAGVFLRLVFPIDIWLPVHLGAPALAPGVIPLAGIAVEALITFIVMLAFLGTAVDSTAPKIGGFGVGLALTGCILWAGPITGAAANPARVFGPGLAAGFWSDHWIYWLGPILGASVASLLYTRVLSKTI